MEAVVPTHAGKNVQSGFYLSEVAGGARKLDDLRPLFDKDAEHPFMLDQIK